MLIDQIESDASPVPPDTLKSRKTFWIFLGAVLISRLIIWTLIPEHPQSFLEVDSPSYTDPAEALIADRSYNTEPGSDTPETLRPPGYPVWLVLIFILSGKNGYCQFKFSIEFPVQYVHDLQGKYFVIVGTKSIF